MPALSIILPVWDVSAELDRAIDSVRRQTFGDWELLVVDHGGCGAGEAALQRCAVDDGRVRVLRLDEPASAGAARNEGLRQARGEFVCYLDVDDEYYPDYVAHLARFRDKGEVLVFAYELVYEDARGPHPNPLPEGEGTGGSKAERCVVWEPARVQGNLFAMNIAKPLGVAHHRELATKVGGFNELLWTGEDWEYWKRLARAGVEFAFLPLKSGRYHARGDGAGRAPHVTARQKARFLENWQAGRPMFEEKDCKLQIENCKLQIGEGTKSAGSPHPNPLRGTRAVGRGEGSKVRKIVYVAPHCLLDPTSGAAVATAQAMRFLQTLGFQCKAFCGSRLDLAENVETMLKRQQIAYRYGTMPSGEVQVPVLVASLGGFGAGGSAETLEVTIFPNEGERQTGFYRACGAFLDADRPDAVVTYGGDPLAETLIRLAKNRDLPLVFWLHNFAYHDPQAFALADYVIVPSQFNRHFYWESIGLACQVLPLVVDWGRVRVARCEISNLKSEISNKEQIQKGKIQSGPHPGPLPRTGEGTEGPNPLPEGDANKLPSPRPWVHGARPLPSTGEGRLARQYATFINPQSTKGLYVFARIAEQLAARRPDIPLLVMAGRSRAGWQQETGIDLSRLPNLTIRPSVRDPREFYAITKLLLMPSLWNESFGLVAAEAMLNGIPVLASNRGALPETIGDAGFLFDIPAKYTPETREVPTAEEVEPWVETIIRLWDDAAEYERWSRAARERAQQWHPDRLAPIYRDFFASITHQPGPPTTMSTWCPPGVPRRHDALLTG